MEGLHCEGKHCSLSLLDFPYNIMSIQLSDYRNQTFEQLVDQAYDKGMDNAGQFTPAELVFELVCAEAQSYGAQKITIAVDGLLEILSDGFGFLRSPVSNFEAGADDVYVSPAQIRRFNLQTGDWVRGQARAPRDNERYLALLRIEQVNERSPEEEKRRLAFDSQSVAAEPSSSTESPVQGVDRGNSVLLEFQAKQNTIDAVVSLLGAFNSAVLTVLNCSPQDAGVLKRAWSEGAKDGRIILSPRGGEANQHLHAVQIGLERSKRLAEQYQDVHWVVFDCNQVALAARFAAEQQGKQGAESLGIEAVCHLLAQARNLDTTGSLTIWIGAHSGRSAYEDAVIERARFEVDHCCTVLGQSDGSLVTTKITE